LPSIPPIDIEADLNADDSKICLKQRWINAAGSSPLFQFALSRMNLAVYAIHLTFPVDEYRGVENSIACFRFQPKYDIRGMFARPRRKPFSYRPRNWFGRPVREELGKAGDVWLEGGCLIQPSHRLFQEIAGFTP